ncbi:MAG: spore maturation protein [Lachnospiraceae bacterium]|nr:spore maturation protein [Lachnospiraceae bacterium]
MRYVIYISNMLIPVIIVYVVFKGIIKKRPVFKDFTDGAADGMKTVANVLPTLIGLMIAVSVLRSSGFLDFLTQMLSGAGSIMNFPVEIIPLAIVKMLSSSAATGLMLDIFKEYGTDSFIGLAASIALSSTETIFYTMSVYFMAANVNKTRWTFPGALIATLAGVIASVAIAGMMV